MDENKVHEDGTLTKKQKAEAAGKDVAEVAARGAGRYFGGPLGGAAVDAALNTKTGQKVVGQASKMINRNPITRNVLAKNQENISRAKPIANSLVGSMGGFDNTSSADIQDDYGESYDDTVSNNISGSGNVSGFWKKIPLKGKLIIIGGVAAFVMLILFIVILITPLMELDIIDIKGSGSSSSSHAYVNISYAYSESINVDGQLYDLDEYVAGVIEAEFGKYLSTGVDEALKVQAIAARTYALYYTNGSKKSIESNHAFQKFNSTPSAAARKIANDTSGLVLSYDNDLFLSKYASVCNNTNCPTSVTFEEGKYIVTYTVLPTLEKNTIVLNDNTYYGQVISEDLTSQEISQLVSFKQAKEGIEYEEILNTVYSSDVKIVDLNNLLVGNIGTEEGSDYIGTYTNMKNGKTYKNYKQYLYRSDAFTFNGKDHLANVGCGTNAAAIVLSGENSSITPATLYIENGYAVGIYFGNYYPYNIEFFNYCESWYDGYCKKTKDNTKISNEQTKEKLISNLSSGGTAILFINYAADKCLVNGESWTGSQHFFTVLDYNYVDNTIYISNPGNNSNSQNGWISLDKFDCVHVAVLLYPE